MDNEYVSFSVFQYFNEYRKCLLFICFQILPRSSGDNCQISTRVSIFHEVLFFLCTFRS